MNLLRTVQAGFDRWAAKPHNAKWVRKLDGTPIANDIVINIFEELKAAADSPPMVEAARLMVDDYQTSASHHPDHVLVPAIAFEALRSALSSLPERGEAVATPGIRWIEWKGGDFLPVPPEMQVTVMLRDGSTEGPAKALEFAGDSSCWKHRGSSGDIVAYTSDSLFASPVPDQGEVERLQEFFDASEEIYECGLLYATEEQHDRKRRARLAILSALEDKK